MCVAGVFANALGLGAIISDFRAGFNAKAWGRRGLPKVLTQGRKDGAGVAIAYANG